MQTFKDPNNLYLIAKAEAAKDAINHTLSSP